METTKSRQGHDTKSAATTSLAILLIVAWLGLAAWAAGVFLIMASLSVATFFGESLAGEYWMEGVAWSLAGAAAAPAGPLGVWLFHRRRGWLIAAGVAAGMTLLVAAYLLLWWART